MHTPHRSPERDAALLALLPRVAEEGWSGPALGAGVAALFPGGAIDMVEAFCDLTDRLMEEEARTAGVPALRISQRVRALVALRLKINRPYKEAVRHAMAVLALPGHAARAVCITTRSVDAIWRAAGDQSADFSWYSKRAILAGVYGGTLLVWLRDHSADDVETLAFLDRRLAGVARIGKARKKLEEAFSRFRTAI